MSVQGYAAMAAKKPLEPFSYETKPLRDNDIQIKVSHCGVCHSDIHLIDNDWGISAYPLVPGHEVVGTVSALGKNVKDLRIGDRVGVGWQAGSCMECEWCRKGEENLCAASEGTCEGNYGGFSEQIQVDGRFAFKIPSGLDSENAAPLLCGGITVYSPLRQSNVTSDMKVGVIGVGGLGHFAIQFAHAIGCEVTAFSTSAEKEAEAMNFGAHRFILSKDSAAMKRAAGSIDFLISTVCANINWLGFVNTLRPKGTLCIVGVAPDNITIPPFPLIVGQRSIRGSVIGNRSTIQEMLTFSARHGIKAKTEVVPISEVNYACDKVRHNKARYRMVLEI